MKLTIGEKWYKERDEYTEELTVEGLDAIDTPIAKGEVVLPENGDSLIEVRIINDITAKFFTTEIRLKNLVQNWERGEAPVEMPGMLV